MNSWKKLVTLALVVTFCAGSALAIEGGNPKKGKYLFKKNCKECHVDGGEAKNLTPLNKTMSQWDRFFKRDKHKDKDGVWNKYSEPDLLDINQFLFDHAADSDQPQTCG